jgi:hypothetical protein
VLWVSVFRTLVSQATSLGAGRLSDAAVPRLPSLEDFTALTMSAFVAAAEVLLDREDAQVLAMSAVAEAVTLIGLEAAEAKHRCQLVASTALNWILRALDRHGRNSVMVERAMLLLRRCAWGMEDKLFLAHIARPVASAMDAHRGVAAVVEHGLVALMNLAVASENEASATRGILCWSGVNARGSGWYGCVPGLDGVRCSCLGMCRCR